MVEGLLLGAAEVFFSFLESIRLISLRLCGGLEPLTEPSFGVVDPREKQLPESTNYKL